MPSPNPRNRVVIFRVTQSEYQSLRDACDETGGRSLSDFARTELLNLFRFSTSRQVFQQRFSEMERRLSELQNALARLERELPYVTEPPANQD